MNKKLIIGAIGVGWIWYLLYSNMKRDKAIKDLQNSLADSNKRIAMLNGMSKALSDDALKTNVSRGTSPIIFPPALAKKFDSTGNATVSPAPYVVVNDMNT